MALPRETCQDCGKVMKGRAIPRVWNGERVVCSACYRTLAAEGKQQESAPGLPARSAVISVSDDDLLSEIVRLAEGRRLVCLTYQKPGEWSGTERCVEPYRLQESTSSLMVQCWQLRPTIEDLTKWRNFRIDRITSVHDGGGSFEPRIPITLCAGEVTAFEWGHEPAVTLGPAAEYFSCLEASMLDGFVSAEELARARELGARVPADERRGVHARVFANVLQEVLQDSSVSETEEAYVAGVRRFLEALGWAP